ncbi:biotin holocarboxylase synthetase [Entomophthora muscae]|uniref:Biotin holocarboxylase synthetase n=2 Tax=Entomophthora muscae TaxID=34485 RepID=A0ACC2TEP0_9FUNG|nr:biotin holocarboxylase synthetase [Entomophthora muscae]KAJ9081052.1 biotin holocarboxylase synthetase [Entomophthora muscae]
MTNTSLIVVPGGRASHYSEDLRGIANRNIIDYVRNGGNYLGFCAGSYYAANQVEFEVGDPELETVGPRPLSFFPGTCRGAAFPGFQYSSEAGAQAARIAAMHTGMVYPVYWNGGGAFINADNYKGVKVLARYRDISNSSRNAAVILTRFGQGRALLSAVHAEYVPTPDNRVLYNAITPYQTRIDNLVSIWLGLLRLELRQVNTHSKEPFVAHYRHDEF